MMLGEQITIKLGEDFNWWVEPNAEDPHGRRASERGVLDPRQVRHLAQTFEKYQSYGLKPAVLSSAFKMFEVEAEVSEGVLRLISSDTDFFEEGLELFALPVKGEDEEGAYHEFLNALSEAHVQCLNKTHHYARDCSVMEMEEELDALDNDRYFAAEVVHVFDEINEILEWSPAEWDDAQS